MHSVKLHRLVTGLVLAAGLVLSGASSYAHGKEARAAGKSGRVPLPVHTIEKGDQCVEPADVMRRDHMQFILHQRDKTMHEGIRTIKHSLKNCVECHANTKTGSVLGKDGFCESCHVYAAVKLDCFECHSALRDASAIKKDGAATALPVSTVRVLNVSQKKASEPATAMGGGSAKREAVPTGTNAGAVFPPKGKKP